MEEEYQDESEMTHSDHEEYVEKKYAEEMAELKSMVEIKTGRNKDETKVLELSSEEPAEAISHSPENKVSEKIGVKFSPNANRNTTYNRVLNAISNN